MNILAGLLKFVSDIFSKLLRKNKTTNKRKDAEDDGPPDSIYPMW